MKHLTLAIPLALLAAFAMLLPATSVNAQTYKSDFSTEVILAGGGTNTGKTVTLNAAVPTASSFTLTFPGTEPGGVVGYVLTMNTTTGGLSWTNPASGLTVNLSGDVGGTSAATVIENTAGTDIVGALNNYGSGTGQVAVNSLDANVLDINSTLAVSTNALGINLANPNTWTGAQNFSSTTATTPLTVTNTGTAGSDDISGDSWYVTNQGQASFTGGILTPSGGGLNNSGSNPTTNIDNSATGGTNNIGNSTSTTNVYGNTNINSPVTGPDANTDIDATGDKGVITIGNNGTGSGDSSTTYLAGAVDFTGTVQLPSGSVTAGSIGLTNQYMLVGNNASPNVATPLAPSANSVLITDATSPIGTPHWAQTLPSGLTYPAAQITGAGNIGGSTVINTTGNIQTSGLATLNTATVTNNLSVGGGEHIAGNDTVVGTLYANTGFNTNGGTTNINSTAAGSPENTNIDASPATGGNVTIGNNTTGLGDSSLTTINGNVNFTGAVNIPAGDLHLGLADDKFYIGNSSGIATPQTITQDVSITDAGVATVNSASGPKFTVSGYEDVSGGMNVTGNDTIGGKLGVTGATSLTTLATSGLATLNTATVTNNLSVGGGEHIAGNDTVVGTLYANTGLTTSGGTANINTSGNSPVNIGTSNSGNTGLITIGDSVTGNVSNTKILGNVNFGGPVTLPSNTTLPLANDEFYIGNASNIAAAQTITQDVSITNAGVATVNSSNATTFAIVHAETVGGTLGVTGQTTLGSTALSSATVAAAATLTLTTSNSAYLLTATAAPVTVNSITGAGTTAGQIITLVNTDPTNNITLHSNGSLVLNGGDVIMTPGGSVTLIYDGSKWRLIGAE
jgi:hypothetical protein